MLDINLEYLRAFYYVVQYASFSKAAEALYLTQPAISRSIRQLEEWSGCLLFIRTSRGVELTGEGRELYQHVEAAMKELINGEGILLKNVKDLSGSLEIGATETPLYHFLLPILSEFQMLHPKVNVGFSGNNNVELWADLRKGAIDVAFIVSPIPEGRPFKTTPLKEVQDIFVAGPAFDELKDSKQTPVDICKYPVTCMAECTSAGRYIRTWFQLNGMTLNPKYSVRTSTLVLPFVLHNLSIGIVPSEFAREHIEKGLIFRIRLTQEMPPRKLYMAVNDDLPRSVICQEFVRFVQMKLLEMI